MTIKYRTFEEGDEKGILKLFHSAFCQNRFCQPRNQEFWNWRYKKNPYGFFPEGIMLAEKNGIIVGSVMVSFHKIRFGKDEFLFGGIDDVATCPILQRRGIARRLMENAIEYTKSFGADGSVLCADPRGHARKLYKKLGYTYKTYYNFSLKIINPLKFKNEFLPIFPFFPLMYLTKLRNKRMKRAKDLQFELLKGTNEQFITKLNAHLKNYFGSNIFDKKYWEWSRIKRPKGKKALNLAVKRNKLIGGGSILKSRYLIIRYNVSHYILADLFVDSAYRRENIGYSILNKLEAIAALESPIMFAFTHKYDSYLNRLLKETGYFTLKHSELEMILPISKDFIQVSESIKDSKKPWIVPLEQAGF